MVEQMGQDAYLMPEETEAPKGAECGECINYQPSPACGANGFCMYAEDFVWINEPCQGCCGYEVCHD